MKILRSLLAVILAVAVIATVGGLFKIEIFGGIAGGLFGPLFAEERLIDVGLFYGRLSPAWTQLSTNTSFWFEVTPDLAGNIGNSEANGRNGEGAKKLTVTDRYGSIVTWIELRPQNDCYVVLERFSVFDPAVIEEALQRYRALGHAACFCYDYSPAVGIGGFPTLDDANNYLVNNGLSGEAIYGAGNFTVFSAATGDVLGVISASNKDCAVFSDVSTMRCDTAVNSDRFADEADYRGGYRLTLGSAGYYSLVNRVELEDYLCGVVPVEMGAHQPLEALKAQAVAARNYAVYPMGKFDRFGFDLDDWVESQAYLGVEVEKPASTEAVRATAGVYILHDGELVQTFFNASSGGYLDSINETWGGKDLPYLYAKADPYSADYHWTYELSTATVTEVLQDMGYYVGEPTAIEIVNRTAGGRVKDMTVYGLEGTAYINGDKFKRMINLRAFKSSLFTFNPEFANNIYDLARIDAMKNGGSGSNPGGTGAGDGGAGSNPGGTGYVSDGSYEVLSAMTTRAVSKNPPFLTRADVANGSNAQSTGTSAGLDDIYKIGLPESEIAYFNWGYITVYGHGYGHGIGMSQLGAAEMAKQGKSYREIIEFYYSSDEWFEKTDVYNMESVQNSGNGEGSNSSGNDASGNDKSNSDASSSGASGSDTSSTDTSSTDTSSTDTSGGDDNEDS